MSLLSLVHTIRTTNGGRTALASLDPDVKNQRGLVDAPLRKAETVFEAVSLQVGICDMDMIISLKVHTCSRCLLLRICKTNCDK